MVAKLSQLMLQQSVNPFFAHETENGSYADSWYVVESASPGSDADWTPPTDASFVERVRRSP